MSAANKGPDEITLEELSRLIRILGMLGSSADGEVLAAARFAAKWVAEKGTDWRTLLTPEPAQGVISVGVAVQEDEFLAREDAAYQRGYREGMANGIKTMAAQVKAQAAAQAPHQSRWTQSFTTPSGLHGAQNAPHSPLGSGLGGLGAGPGSSGSRSAQGPVRASGGLGGGGGGSWQPGSWQAVAQALLDRHATVPGVLRSREEVFVTDVLARGFASLTSAQESWLRDIAGRNGMNW